MQLLLWNVIILFLSYLGDVLFPDEYFSHHAAIGWEDICFLNSICFALHLDATLVMGFYTAVPQGQICLYLFFWTQIVLSYT